MMISSFLFQEMIISDIDKNRKLGFLLSMFIGALFYSIKRRKNMSRVILNEIISFKINKIIMLLKMKEFFRTEKRKYADFR